MMEIRISCLLLIISISCLVSDAFVPRLITARHPQDRVTKAPSNVEIAVSSALNVKKRRRRRNNDGGEDNVEADTSSGDLPDFDLDEDEEEPKPKKRVIRQSNPDEITPAMMGSADGPVRSIKDLLSDRSLESKFDFSDVETDDSLPDLVALSQQRAEQENVQPGKKKARQAERRASAIAAKESATESPLSNLPFVSDEEGKVQPLKVRWVLSSK